MWIYTSYSIIYNDCGDMAVKMIFLTRHRRLGRHWQLKCSRLCINFGWNFAFDKRLSAPGSPLSSVAMKLNCLSLLTLLVGLDWS